MEGLLKYIRSEGKHERSTRIFSDYMKVVITVSEKKDAGERRPFPHSDTTRTKDEKFCIGKQSEQSGS
jgi:hypothetical protein